MPCPHRPPSGPGCPHGPVSKILLVRFLTGAMATLLPLETLPALADTLVHADAWPLELSGACRLPDGRFVLVDDETRTTCYLWDGDASDLPYRVPLAEPLDDLEAAAADSVGQVYLLTSHSLTKKGAARADRRHLARLSGLVQGPTAGVLTQKPRLELADDLLGPLTGALGVPAGAINLEGLAWYPGADQLLLGVRAPLSGNLAQVVGLGPIDALFGRGEPGTPVVHRLDLGGRGIRSLDYDPWRRQVWVLAGPAGADTGAFALYLWDPATDALVLNPVPGLDRLAQPEGVVALAPPDTAGRSQLLFAGEGAAAAPEVLTTQGAASAHKP